MEEPPVHEAAEIFPLMNETDLMALTADIAEHGLREPISLYDGQIVDGRNRLEACKRAKVKPRFVDVTLNGTGPLEFVISKNITQRHPSLPQRAALAVTVLPELQAQASKRKSALAKGEATWEDLPAELGSAGSATKHAADLVGIGRSTVERAARYADKNPTIIQRMRDGEFISVNQAGRSVGEVVRRDGAINGQPIRQWSRGDKWREVIKPMSIYLRGWERRGFEFRHINHTEAQKRLKEIARLQEGLEAIKNDLEPRSIKATVRPITTK